MVARAVSVTRSRLTFSISSTHIFWLIENPSNLELSKTGFLGIRSLPPLLFVISSKLIIPMPFGSPSRRLDIMASTCVASTPLLFKCLSISESHNSKSSCSSDAIIATLSSASSSAVQNVLPQNRYSNFLFLDSCSSASTLPSPPPNASLLLSSASSLVLAAGTTIRKPRENLKLEPRCRTRPSSRSWTTIIGIS